jgi:lysophospholipase L1-like esterase
MIDASSDGINGVGSTLADYRTAIATEQSTRSAWCNLVDGTAIMSTAELVDGVHPNAAGHALYLAYVKTVLGL